MVRAVVHDRARPTRADLELPLTVVALLGAAITPNVFVAGGLEWMSASVLAKYVLLPAAVIQIAILFYARGRCPRLFNRLVTGLWVGLIATTGLDVVRQPGTFLGFLAHDEARMAGEMMLGAGHGQGGVSSDAKGDTHAASGPAAKKPHRAAAGEKRMEETARTQKPSDPQRQPAHGGSGDEMKAHGDGGRHVGAADFVGYAYHYWNGASFAVIYALVFGRTPWWGPLLYAVLFIETGMLVFMQAAMPPLTWGIVLTSFFAHVVYGTVLGVLFARFLRDEGTIFELLTVPRLQTAP